MRLESISMRARGFSLVEIMVAMVIALIGVIVIFQVFSVSEGTKRTTTGGGDAQQAGALALFTIERDLRQAGYGMNVSQDLGCAVSAYDGNREPAQRNFQFTLAPVRITQGAGTAPDTIEVMYGAYTRLVHPALLAANQAGVDSAPIRVDNRYGFNLGDVIIIAGSGPQRCMMAQVTSLPPSDPSAPGYVPGDDNVINHAFGNYTDSGGNTKPAQFNEDPGNPFGLAPFVANDRVYNLGRQPIRNQYSLLQTVVKGDDGKNHLNSSMQVLALGYIVNAPPIVADNIVQLKAQYGKQTAGGFVWDNTTPANAADWQTVVAVRIAAVARSTLPEVTQVSPPMKDATTPACGWSTTGPVVGSDKVCPTSADGFVLDITADETWRFYRYKVFETIVPLRNQLWQQQ